MNILMMKLQNSPEFKESAIRLHLHINGMDNMLSNSVQDPNAQGKVLTCMFRSLIFWVSVSWYIDVDKIDE
jgi:hypothetical protein